MKKKLSFGDVYYSNTDDFEKLDEEVFEAVKEGIKTTITVRFNKGGYPVGYTFESDKQKKPKSRFIKKRA